ncbi:hypothetical protein L1887_37963 [Cichorium endivia]|nr:hypothetical protein L1887_37963 [Cichorium endivia]
MCKRCLIQYNSTDATDPSRGLEKVSAETLVALSPWVSVTMASHRPHRNSELISGYQGPNIKNISNFKGQTANIELEPKCWHLQSLVAHPPLRRNSPPKSHTPTPTFCNRSSDAKSLEVKSQQIEQVLFH